METKLKMAKGIITTIRESKTWPKVVLAFDVFMADAQSTIDRFICLCSALFWTWLEMSFIKVFFTFAFGLVSYVATDSFEMTWDIMLRTNDMAYVFTIAFVIIIFITRVPLHYNKSIDKRESKRTMKDTKT